ncbi:MAG: LOG family protein [Deltaproteobacteria bacterium]|nr:MAG: LOG family protein [Deltaproteobacteria bacterium]
MDQKTIRKVLKTKLKEITDALYDLEVLLGQLEGEFFRVCIFGSARIRPDDQLYQTVEHLAYLLALENIDVVTGGGPGLMEAANKGAQRGKTAANSSSRSIGLPITLPTETGPNPHLDVKSHHRKFSTRLDEFMRISNAVVVTLGGIGTLLEFFFTWQLLQMGHISERPIILLGRDFWRGLLDWIEKEQLSRHLLSKKDLRHLHLVDTPEEALAIIRPVYAAFRKQQRSSNRTKKERKRST